MVAIEIELGNCLKQKGYTFSTAESCTGGGIAKSITSVAGCSEYYKGSVVSYCNEVKHKVLSVSLNDIEKHTAVSESVVIQMAKGVAELLNTDVSVAVSGIAGPSGGTDEIPIGTIWIAAYLKNKIITQCLHLHNDRSSNIEQAIKSSLMLVMKLIRE